MVEILVTKMNNKYHLNAPELAGKDIDPITFFCYLYVHDELYFWASDLNKR